MSEPGTLTVGIAEEDTGRVTEYSVPEGSAIVVPQGMYPQPLPASSCCC